MLDATNPIHPPLALGKRLRRACNRVAPLWPLRDFVAVNPFYGLADQGFAEAARTLRRVGGLDMLPPRASFAEALRDGRVTPADFSAAGADAALLQQPRPAAKPSPSALLVTDVLDAALATDWSGFCLDEIAKWLAAWSDDGQAAWRMPWRDRPLYAAWRAAMRHDRAAEVAGLAGFRAALARLPEQPEAACAAALAEIGIAEGDADDHLHRALLSVAGWAGLMRRLGWPAELAGESHDGVLNLLAVRLSWEAALHALHARDPGFRSAWAARLAAEPAPPPDLSGDVALLEAAEIAFRRRLAGGLARQPGPRPRPAAQAVFCIDVRSEVFRRALETVAPEVETLGFAGFFGFAIEHVRFGDSGGSAQCPVLLSPSVLVCERLAEPSAGAESEALRQLTLSRRLAQIWDSFRASAVSCFAYVETAGMASAVGLLRGVLRRPASAPALPGLMPDVAPSEWRGRMAGMADAARVDAAEAVLRAMSLTEGFGGLVLLAGHGARTVNNPHAAGLDCGACGGHAGDSNARVAAAVLNDPLVREGLAARGIDIPADTWFVAALHDTVTDEVTVFDAERVPPSRRAELARLQARLAEAARRARAERAPRLGLGAEADAAAETASRAGDWSEVRPEWALANNAAFVAAPRWRTQGLDLAGRCFLHSYDWREDRGFGVLELILTAPMVVANWINLQYFGSVVDNRVWGSGNKALHNVVGLHGVLEGQGGDLRSGLPWQSVHDGVRFAHEPLRLSVFIEAPAEEMDRALEKHANVRELVDNGWLHLLAIRDDGSVARRFAAGDWRAEG